MAIIKCIKCGEEFNDKDNVCPNCACLIKCSLKKDNNKINDEESQDKKYDVTINIVHSIRTNMLLKCLLKEINLKKMYLYLVKMRVVLIDIIVKENILIIKLKIIN